MKNKLFSFINIVGLGLALPFALLALIQVQSAFETDNFHPQPEKTYRIITDVTKEDGSKIKYATSPQNLSEKLAGNYPFVDKATTVIRQYDWALSHGLQSLDVNVIFVEPDFFDVFGFRLAAGTVPVAPNTIAITKEKAQAFFGKENPLGKSLIHPDMGAFLITGVIENYKRNTHLRSDVMVSIKSLKKTSAGEGALAGLNYAMLHDENDKSKLRTALSTIADDYNREAASKNQKEKIQFRLQNIDKLAPDFEGLWDNSYIDSWGDLTVNFAFAMALLLLAAFNYINLTLAKSISRSREVGIRKVSGALRYQLVVQFICEAILISLISLLIGYIVLRFVENFMYVNWFSWQVDNQWLLWSTFILFTLFVGFLAGITPARILSSFQPVQVLKGTVSPSGFGKRGLRNTLVVIQFVVTSCFIFIMSALYSQLKYMATDNSNFNRQNIYNIAVKDKAALLAHDLSSNKDIERVGMASLPFGGIGSTIGIKKSQQENNAEANYYTADGNFVSNMQLKIIAGKNLPVSVGDSASPFVLINERLLNALGMGNPQEATGKKIIMNDSSEVIIAGVTDNFCYGNYQFMAKPLIMQYDPAKFHALVVKVKNETTADALRSELLPVWKKYFPASEFFISDYSKTLYETYFPAGDMRIMILFCVILVVISLMGLLGIVTYDTEKRVKEIGIRKTLGASVPAIVQQLSKSFLKLILISAFIALPLGFIGGNYFMKLFAYNEGLNIWMMTFLFALIMLFAIVTIIYKGWKAATGNPVKSLRTE